MALKAAEILASALEADALAMEHGQLEPLETRIASVRRQVQPINDIPRPIFKLAIRFWKEWSKALHHGARYPGPLQADDWPELARIVAQHVRQGTMPNDRRLIDTFVRRRQKLPWRDLKMLFGKSE